MTLAQVSACGVVGMFTSWLVVWLVRKRSLPVGGVSRAAVTQFHHTHENVVRRLGGIAFAVSFVAVALLASVLLGFQPFHRQTSMTLVLGALSMFADWLGDELRLIGAGKQLLF